MARSEKIPAEQEGVGMTAGHIELHRVDRGLAVFAERQSEATQL